MLNDGDTELLLTLQAVQDSRCPKEVQCIRYGNATVTLQFGDKAPTSDLQMCLGDCNNKLQQTDQAEQKINQIPYLVRLLSVDPYPKADDTAPHKEARIIVERL